MRSTRALVAMVVYGLPADYFDRYRDRVRAVTRDEVLAAAQRASASRGAAARGRRRRCGGARPARRDAVRPAHRLRQGRQAPALTGRPPKELRVEPIGKVSGERKYTGRVVNLDVDRVRFPDGSIGELEMIRHSGASAIVPLLSDPVGSGSAAAAHPPVPLRHRGLRLRDPRGAARGGRAAGGCARRELKEETGCTAERSSGCSRCTRRRDSPTRRSTSSWRPGSTRGDAGARGR